MPHLAQGPFYCLTMSDPFGPPPPPAGDTSGSWKESVAEFIDARLELFRLEAREASRTAVQRGVLLGVALVGLALTWLLLLAGVIGWMASRVIGRERQAGGAVVKQYK